MHYRHQITYHTILWILALFVIIGFGITWWRAQQQTRTPTAHHEGDPLAVPDDALFARGFTPTNASWPPTVEDLAEIAEGKEHPLVALRKSYCERVGYTFAHWGNDCYSFQYFDAFHIATSTIGEFHVYYPELWKEDHGQRHAHRGNIDILLRRQHASCVIAYGVVDTAWLHTLTGAVEDTRWEDAPILRNVLVGGLTGIRRPFERMLSPEERAAGYTNTSLIVIPHFPRPTSRGGFILSSGSRQPLLQACVDEFGQILASTVIHYPTGKLSTTSVGTIQLLDVTSSFEGGTSTPPRYALIFTDTQGNEQSIVPDALREITSITSPLFSGRILFYLDGTERHQTLRALDIFSGNTHTLELPPDPEQSISSFFVRGKTLYYLTGVFCSVPCPERRNLMSYDLVTRTHTLLSRELTVNEIRGFNATADSLLLRSHVADAGCAWGTYVEFPLSTRVVQHLGTYSYCTDDNLPEYPEGRFEQHIDGSVAFDRLEMNNGILSPPATAPTTTQYNVIPLRIDTHSNQ